MALPRYGPTNPEGTYVPHSYAEQSVDLGEVKMNYAVSGSSELPSLLLIPGQSESWWGYEQAIPLLDQHFRVFAVDLRGQGRTTWTPGRYTLDNFGNDLVRFISLVVKRPTIVSGLSSGGVIAAWLSAYAMPGQIRGAHYEDPPLFASETNPACGQSIRQGVGAIFELWNRYLGDQWTVGDYQGMTAAARDDLPPHLRPILAVMQAASEDPPQNLKEYDPEWARAFWTGMVGASCDHERMLSSVKCPVLFTHHFRRVDEAGYLLGASSDVQAKRVQELVEAADQPFTYRSFPTMAHSMHGQDPALFATTLSEWAASLAQIQMAPPTGLEPVHPAPEVEDAHAA